MERGGFVMISHMRNNLPHGEGGIGDDFFGGIQISQRHTGCQAKKDDPSALFISGFHSHVNIPLESSFLYKLTEKPRKITPLFMSIHNKAGSVNGSGDIYKNFTKT